jgi:hypothetical protein
MISDLDIGSAANILVRRRGSDAGLEAAKRADLMKGTILTGNLSGADQAGGQSSSCTLPRTGRHIEPREDGDGRPGQRDERRRPADVDGGCRAIRPSSLCASSGFISLICSSL